MDRYANTWGSAYIPIPCNACDLLLTVSWAHQLARALPLTAATAMPRVAVQLENTLPYCSESGDTVAHG